MPKNYESVFFGSYNRRVFIHYPKTVVEILVGRVSAILRGLSGLQDLTKKFNKNSTNISPSRF